MLFELDEFGERGVDGFLAGPGEADSEALAGLALVGGTLGVEDGADPPFGLAGVLDLCVWLEVGGHGVGECVGVGRVDGEIGGSIVVTAHG